MPSDIDSQVRVGPFTFGDLPDKDASILHITEHWHWLLTEAEYRLLMSVWMRTTRFLKKSAQITKAEFEAGMAANQTLGFAGVMPVVLSKSVYYRSLQTLVDIGILRKDGDDIAIDYSTTMVDLVQHEVVQKRVIARTRRDPHGAMDAEDAIEYVQSVMSQSRSTGTNQSRSTGTPINRKNNTTPTRARVSGGYETVEEMRAALAVKKQVVRDKRLKRGNATDYGKLFQAAWHSAMKERFPKIPRTPWNEERVVSRVKRQIIRPALDAGVNVEELARFIVLHWFKIKAKHLKWANEYPSKPVINFVLARIDDYMTAFATADGDSDGEAVEHSADEVKRLAAQLAETTSKLRQAEQKAVEVISAQAEEIKKLKKRRPVLRSGPVASVLPSYDERINGDKK